MSAPALDDPSPVVQAAPAPGPGAALRAAREASGLTQADVSQVIRFSIRQIDALESDDYDSLPGATVVRGLIRNYAKLLRLDAAPLLAALDPTIPVAESEVREPTNMGAAASPMLADRFPVRYLLAGFLGILFLLFGLWHFSSIDGAKSTDRSVTVPVPTPAKKAESVLAPVLVPLATEAGVSAANSAATVTPLNAPVSSNALAPHTGLRLEFDDRSWVEVRDASQRVVFVGEYPGGMRQNIDGKGPFYLWIGRASGMRVFVGERSIDLRPHTREDVARLTVE